MLAGLVSIHDAAGLLHGKADHPFGFYRRLRRVPALNLPFDKSPSLGGRSEEISQICVVWGKAVALSRYQIAAKALNSIELAQLLLVTRDVTRLHLRGLFGNAGEPRS
jgi:hypothetical protein